MKLDAAALREDVPGLRLSVEGDDLTHYGRDWTRLHPPAPCGVAFPETVEQVQAIVHFARRTGTRLVPSGGRTGLSGGAVAADGELVVSMDRLNRIGDVDRSDLTIQLGAGVVTERLQQVAEENGLFFPVDFASAGSSQLGGNLATNAGGIRVLRYGMMRDWVAGLKVVTGRGDILDLNRGLVKNATGYDLRHLFVGSEGTLGFIVEATMNLCSPPPPQAVMVLAVAELPQVMDLFAAARERLVLSAFEVFSDLALAKVLERSDARAPFETRAPWYVLLEFDQDEDAALALFEAATDAGWSDDGLISQSEGQAAQLWALRENISEAISHDTPYKNDISVRIGDVTEFLQRLDAVVAEHYPDFDVVWFGHIGDGNLHLNILKPADLEVAAFATACERVNGWVYGLVEEFGGSVSAEHGVGLLKKPYLVHTRSETELGYLRSLRDVFDPDGILNPGKLVD